MPIVSFPEAIKKIWSEIWIWKQCLSGIELGKGNKDTDVWKQHLFANRPKKWPVKVGREYSEVVRNLNCNFSSSICQHGSIFPKGWTYFWRKKRWHPEDFWYHVASRCTHAPYYRMRPLAEKTSKFPTVCEIEHVDYYMFYIKYQYLITFQPVINQKYAYSNVKFIISNSYIVWLNTKNEVKRDFKANKHRWFPIAQQ